MGEGLDDSGIFLSVDLSADCVASCFGAAPSSLGGSGDGVDSDEAARRILWRETEI